MTQSPFEPPNEPSRQSEPPATGPSRPLSFDEMIALLVAFLSLGSVLFWGLSRGGMDVFQTSFLTADTALEGPKVSLGRNRPLDLDDETTADEAIALGRTQRAENNALRADEPSSARRERDERVRRDRNQGQNDMTASVSGATTGTGVIATPNQATATPDEIAPDAPKPAVTEPAATEPAITESEQTSTAPVTEQPPSPITLSENARAEPKVPITFNDVPDNYWAKPYIDALSSRNLISGFDSGDFMPEQPVTRAQVANIVSRTFALTTDKASLDFGDVASDYWARDSIGDVVKGGFMTGFPDNTFAPNAPITRAQALTTLVTGLGVSTPTNVQAALSRYIDANEIPKWANEKVAAATSGNLVVNYPNADQLHPTKPTTRAELSAMIYQALAREGVVAPVDSDYMVKP